MNKIFNEENGIYQIDLSTTVNAIGNLHEKYKNIGHFLSDVDFVFETEEDIFLVEYKNTDIDKSDPTKFLIKVSNGEIYNWIHKKFYGSMFYVLSAMKNKKINFIFVLECKEADDIVRKRIRNKAKNRLPFRLQADESINRNLIHNFEILSIAQWNEIYPMYPISKV
ncbi:MAG: hypothetical protein R3Y24_00380 [Eubacteriales bacterium]